MSKTTVPVTTLDAQWEAMGKPLVSVIKIDVEGADLETLKGATAYIQLEQPCILIEWNLANLKAYGCHRKALLDFAEGIQDKIFSLPYFIPVHDSAGLATPMLLTERFLHLPNDED